MTRKPRGKQAEIDPACQKRRRGLFVPVLLLLGTGLACNVYLTQLYLDVQQAGGVAVDSFCNVDESVHCSSVAASRYAAIYGVPVALIAMEFYIVLILAVLLSHFRRWAVRSWDSLVFWAMVAGLPVTALMAYIAAFRLGIVCPLCAVTYGVNLSMLLLVSLANARRFKLFVREGIGELGSALTLRAARLGVAALLIVGFSQVLWFPPLVRRTAQASTTAPHKSTPASKGRADFLAGAGSVVGPEGAPIRIVEFSDYQCSVCRFGHDIMAKLLRAYRGQIRFQHRDFPLDTACNRKITRPFHIEACKAAYYARCAEEQGKYWSYADLLFHHQEALHSAGLQSLATRVDLDLMKLRSCVRRSKTRQAVLTDIEEGIRRRIEGTPTFFVNGQRVVGPRDLPWWRSKIERLLAKDRAQKN